MKGFHPQLRVFMILACVTFDLVVLQSYVKAYDSLPFTFRAPFVDQFLPASVQNVAVPPIAPQDNVELSEIDWQGTKFIGKLTNNNSFPVYNTEIEVALSLTQEPWTEHQKNAFTVPTVIEPGKSLFFSKTLSQPKLQQFWWSAMIAQSSEHTDQEVEKLPKDLRVSEKKFPIQTTQQVSSDPGPWGVAKQLDDVTWTIKVGQDDRMATAQETFAALNQYRQTHGVAALSWDDNLAAFAKERATYLNSIKATDKHQGFKDYIANEDNIKKLGFYALGENSGYGHKLYGVHLIEWIYASDEGHNKNQLDPQWSHVGIGIEGLGVAFIFGGSKI